MQVTVATPHAMFHLGDELRVSTDGRVWRVVGGENQRTVQIERLGNRKMRRAERASKRRARGY